MSATSPERINEMRNWLLHWVPEKHSPKAVETLDALLAARTRDAEIVAAAKRCSAAQNGDDPVECDRAYQALHKAVGKAGG